MRGDGVQESVKTSLLCPTCGLRGSARFIFADAGSFSPGFPEFKITKASRGFTIEPRSGPSRSPAVECRKCKIAAALSGEEFIRKPCDGAAGAAHE